MERVSNSRLCWETPTLIALLVLSAACSAPGSEQAGAAGGYVLQAEQGEKVLGNTLIKVSPRSGAPAMAMGVSRFGPRSRIGLHVHERADEILFIQKGSGTGVVGSEQTPLSEGATIYVPRGVWHDVQTGEESLQVLWFVSPPGLDDEMREADRVSNGGTRALTIDELNEIARKHGNIYKDTGR